MEKKLKLDMKDMTILQFEVGNLKKWCATPADVRPVCALLLTDKSGRHSVKVLFKNDSAINVYNYILNRRSIGTIIDESCDMVGYLREIRESCLVVDDIESVVFNTKLSIY
jgi:hypothetical protein